MPSKSRPQEKRLLSLFLSRYADCVWKHASLDWRDEREDGAVELVATRPDGRTLAIEHTLIQPFPDDRRDIEQFRPLLAVAQDKSLLVPGKIVHVYVPVGTVQKRCEEANIRELRAWIGERRTSLPEGVSQHSCMFSGRRGAKEQTLTVRVVVDPKSEGHLLVSRCGPLRLDQTVEKALRTKVPKLVGTAADERILLLEHHGWSVDGRSIGEEVGQLELEIAGFDQIDAVWFVETTPSEDIAFFCLYEEKLLVHTLMFLGGRLVGESHGGMPVSIHEQSAART